MTMGKRFSKFSNRRDLILERLVRVGKVLPQDEAYVESRLVILQRSVDESARIYQTVLIAFLTFIVYFWDVALSVDHVVLFKNSVLKAPILNFNIKASFYFAWAPFILLFLHLGLLIQSDILNKKTKSYAWAIKGLSEGELEEAEALSSLPSLPLAQIEDRHNCKKPFKSLLWLLIAVTLILIPVATLVVLLLQFLPYQSWLISCIHWYALVIDLAMSFLFFKNYYLRHPNHKLALKIASCTVSATVLIMAVMPPIVSFNDFNLWKWDLIKDKVTLSVPRKQLYLETQHSSLNVCMEENKTLGLDLKRRSYINANLSGAVLCHAILDDAQLQGASLDDAQLQGASLNSAQLQGASLDDAQLQEASLDDAQLQRASLNSAQLQEASLLHAQLQGASLNDAKLQGASLDDAQLQGASLNSAQLQRASLDDAQLQGASLDDAQLQGASLDDAQLQGASLRGAQLQGASLNSAQLQGASLNSAQLQGASLLHAQLQGASLRGAQLQGARLDNAQLQRASLDDAQLQGASLNSAQLQGASLNSAQLQGASLFHAQLQGTSLTRAQLQGVFSSSRRSRASFLSLKHGNVPDINAFEMQINDRIDKDSDFSAVVFTGGLDEKRVAEIEEALKQVPTIEEEDIREIMDRLRPHVGKPVGKELPEDAGATSGRYTKEEAEQWIREYYEAIEAQ